MLARKVSALVQAQGSLVRAARYGVANSPLFDHRRAKTRELWGKTEDDDAEVLVFPNEHLGENHIFNWALNLDGIAPAREAFHNLHLRGLLMFSQGKTSPEKTLLAKAPAGHKTFVVAPKSSNPSIGTISDEEFAKIARTARAHLSDVDRLFVQDGAIGNLAKSEIVIREITDNANVGLYNKHTYNRTKTPDDFILQKEIVGYTAASFNEIAELGRSEKSFTVVHPEKKIAVTLGYGGFSASRLGVSSLASYLSFQKGDLFLPADSISNGSSSLLVFSPTSVLLKGLNVYGANNTIWTAGNRLTRAWGGFLLPQQPAGHQLRRGDAIETVADGKVNVVGEWNSAQGTSIDGPSAVVFLTTAAKAPKIASINVQQAVSFLVKNEFDSFQKDEILAAFEKRLQDSGVKLFVVRDDTLPNLSESFNKITANDSSIPQYKPSA
eukprot:TRINITY_DN2126_c0_g1_i1.p1 TRINITY_DN2126_c0_g1~~TRINITY_DN2126_c0_g1_i1.p1  ORF type:complete len:439 (+),score=217.30 TRINITY_DN2126_c0_g1_i1:101-1417(+)